MLGEGLAEDDPNNSEQRIFLEPISPQHWGDASSVRAKQGGAAARYFHPLLPRNLSISCQYRHGTQFNRSDNN
ncbi:MAG: hypothetical protein DYG96_04220 [Chlorobi bacterium CHB2]|nr:hypothetical protein [Chlorobi bacterium CHB2]